MVRAEEVVRVVLRARLLEPPVDLGRNAVSVSVGRSAKLRYARCAAQGDKAPLTSPVRRRIASPISGLIGSPTPKNRELPVERGERSAVAGRPAQGAPEVTELDREQRRVRARTGPGEERIDRLGTARPRAPGSRSEPAPARAGPCAEPAARGPAWRRRCPCRARARAAATAAPWRRPRCRGRPLDQREGLPAQEVRKLGERRQVEHASDRGQLLGHPGRLLRPAMEYLRGALQREEQRPRVDLADRQELELDGCDRPEAAAAAAQGPEQVGLAVGVDAQSIAAGGDDLGADDRVAGQTVAAGPASRGLRRWSSRPRPSGGQTVLGGRVRDLVPQRAGVDSGDARLCRSGRRACARCTGARCPRGRRSPRCVAGSLCGDPHAAFAREADDGLNGGGGLGKGDDRGTLGSPSRW